MFLVVYQNAKAIIKKILKHLICCQETEYLWAFLRNSLAFPDQKLHCFKVGAWKEQTMVILKEQDLIIWTLCLKEWVSKVKIHRVWSWAWFTKSNSSLVVSGQSCYFKPVTLKYK